jgi:hypothetical protein
MLKPIVFSMCLMIAAAASAQVRYEIHYVDANKNEVGSYVRDCQGNDLFFGQSSGLSWERLQACAPGFICEDNGGTYKCVDGVGPYCVPQTWAGNPDAVCTGVSDPRYPNQCFLVTNC